MRRNATPRDGCYRPQLADWYARGRRSRSRRNRRFSAADWARVQTLMREDWSPEQIAGRLRRHRELAISHETIYRHLWADKHAGGTLYRHLRGARKQRRKRYGRYDSRGRVAGKRSITTRPPIVAARTQLGHWEGDTVLGASQAGPCVLSLVERKTGYLVVGKLPRRSTAAVNQCAQQLIDAQPHPVRTLTVDNGTEFHDYAALERGHGDPVLLRDAASRLGTRDQRKHQRPAPAVSPQGPEHDPSHPSRLRSDCPEAKSAAQKTPGLSNAGGVLCPLRRSVALQS